MVVCIDVSGQQSMCRFTEALAGLPMELELSTCHTVFVQTVVSLCTVAQAWEMLRHLRTQPSAAMNSSHHHHTTRGFN